MALYRVFYATTAYFSVEVKADSPEEAEELSWEYGCPQPCHQEQFELAGDWDIDAVEKVED